MSRGAKSDTANPTNVAALLEEASLSMKSDLTGTLARLESGYRACLDGGDRPGAGAIACALSRGWARKKSPARSVHYARKSTLLAPENKSSWTTLAKTCELVALRCDSGSESRRAKVLFAASARAFKKAASMTSDPEDKRWLLELASDAAKQAQG
ncbi:MAG: hypothetical protein KBF88_01450 [Polyangiaceae bacterium]|nr:hypothetical protein [Polyangiaceae bacterium]